MISNVVVVAKKELARFFSNRASAFVAVILPGLLIFLMWSIMGNAMSSMFSPDESEPSKVAVVNMPVDVGAFADASDIDVEEVAELPDAERIRENIEEGDVNAYAVFPEGFDETVEIYDPASGMPAPHVEVYYDSADTASAGAYETFTSMLDAYESSLSNRFDVNGGGGVYDVADGNDRSMQFIVSIVPLLLFILLFSGCMSIAAESVAGEKERGTMATLLATPVRRSEIALGKVIALALIGLAIAASSFIGIVAGLPNLMQGQMSINLYGVSEYALLILVIFSTTLVMVVLIAIVSALAKTTKEAQVYLTPLMIVVMGVGFLGMFGEAKTDVVFYLIPLYNSVQCMIGIFTFEFQPLDIMVCIVSNLIYTGIGVAVLRRMFDSERLMFAR